MATNSTIIITGGTGDLGSAIARSLATHYPGRFHMILTCCSTTIARAVSISNFLNSQNAAFSFELLDLSDLGDVKVFASRIKSKILAGEIPALIGGAIVNSAAFMTVLKDAKAKDGFDVVYTVNCLAPMLLVRSLLPELLDGVTVLNVGR
jgi:NAD(P)-dependent dehydrogenase (short-subunit alcohol dehydrogenase family)